MARVKLSEAMDSLVKEARASLQAPVKEEASEKLASLNLSNDEVKGLVKLAGVVRSVNIEPTYEDLYTFVGGLNGCG
tara:strand:+ start:843 stop:1073 length:231 start_codon:yes stop_codon:yes gene_type:complete